jgi:hypothetical protein
VAPKTKGRRSSRDESHPVCVAKPSARAVDLACADTSRRIRSGPECPDLQLRRPGGSRGIRGRTLEQVESPDEVRRRESTRTADRYGGFGRGTFSGHLYSRLSVLTAEPCVCQSGFAWPVSWPPSWSPKLSHRGEFALTPPAPEFVEGSRERAVVHRHGACATAERPVALAADEGRVTAIQRSDAGGLWSGLEYRVRRVGGGRPGRRRR